MMVVDRIARRLDFGQVIDGNLVVEESHWCWSGFYLDSGASCTYLGWFVSLIPDRTCAISLNVGNRLPHPEGRFAYKSGSKDLVELILPIIENRRAEISRKASPSWYVAYLTQNGELLRNPNIAFTYAVALCLLEEWDQAISALRSVKKSLSGSKHPAECDAQELIEKIEAGPAYEATSLLEMWRSEKVKRFRSED